MKIVSALTIRHLRMNKGRTLITLIGIALSVAMICSTAGFALSYRAAMRKGTVDYTGDFHIAVLDIPLYAAAQIGADGLFSGYYTLEDNPEDFIGAETEDGYVNLYLKLKEPWKYYGAALDSALSQHGVHSWLEHSTLILLDGGILSKGFVDDGAIRALGIMIGLIVVCTIAAIGSAFAISAAERVRQFGVLKSVGATGGQIGLSVIFEAIVLLVIAVPIGILLGTGIQAAVAAVLNRFIDGWHFSLVVSPAAVAASVAIAVLTVIISAWLPARRAAKTPAIDAIRQTKEVRIRKRDVKVSRLTETLFGVEGTLAAKAIKRSRTKHHAAVISLSLGIMLLITISTVFSTLGTIITASDEDNEQQMYDVFVSSDGNLDFYYEVDAIIMGFSDATIITERRPSAASADVPIEFHSQESPWHGRTGAFLNFAPLPDDEFVKFAPIAEEEQGGAAIIGGILLNVPTEYKGEVISYYVFTQNMVLTFMRPIMTYGDDDPVFEEGFKVKLSAEVTEDITLGVYGIMPPAVLLPESLFRKFCAEYNLSTHYYIDTGNADALCAALEARFGDDNPNLYIRNNAAYMRQVRNTTLMFELFAYGFIFMLTLISVTGIVTTISTGMALRRREFAMLYSTGMDKSGMNKMLNLESLMYSAKSLFVGFPAGVVLSYVLYLLFTMTNENSPAYPFPWLSGLICVGAVLLISFGTMHYSKRKMQGISIVEALRSEVV